MDKQTFNRIRKNLSVTIEGEWLLDYGGRILSVHDEAVCRLTKPGVSAKLRVGWIDYFLPEIVPGLLSKFRKQYPNISLVVPADFGINFIPASGIELLLFLSTQSAKTGTT